MKVRLFPLPDVVLFPRTLLPLRVFELRYRQMLKDALGSDKKIGVAMLKEGWQRNYYGAPPIHEIFTVGRIARYQANPDGTFNIGLYGVERVRLASERPHELYRIGEVEPVPDEGVNRSRGRQAGFDRRIRQSVTLVTRALLDKGRQAEIAEGIGRIHALGELADYVAAALVVDPKLKQSLLETPDVLARAEALQRILARQLQGPLPPPSGQQHNN